jgi:hypothetical protein
MSHYGTLAIRDNSKELSRFTVNYGAVTAASLPGLLTDWGNLKTAVAGVTIGELANEVLTIDNTVLSSAVPTNPFAQRELKLKVNYVGDTTGKPYHITIACPDLTNLTLNNTDEVLLADGGIMAALVTAMETIMRTPDDDTETVTVVSAYIVGRNN